jgi:hypothetical protein
MNPIPLLFLAALACILPASSQDATAPLTPESLGALARTYVPDSLQAPVEAAAWAKAHPPVPRDETFIFRPHRGSRYLADPQPEKKGEAIR